MSNRKKPSNRPGPDKGKARAVRPRRPRAGTRLRQRDFKATPADGLAPKPANEEGVRKGRQPKPPRAGKTFKPLNASSILPNEMLDKLCGLPSYTRDTIPIVMPGMHSAGLRFFLRGKKARPGSADQRCTYIIEDRGTDVEGILHGREHFRERQSTGCKEGDEERARDVALLYLGLRRSMLLSSFMPTQVPIADIIDFFEDDLRAGGHDLAPNTLAYYLNVIKPLRTFFRELRLGALDKDTCRQYHDWRQTQHIAQHATRAHLGTARLVSLCTIAHEIGALRRAVNLWRDHTKCGLDPRFWRPTAPRPNVAWLDRAEAARYFWALRGMIWNAERGRFRIRRDDDPSLVGPEGDRHVLRSPEVIANRKAMVRLALVGIYTGSRVSTLMAATYDDESSAHMKLAAGVFSRRGLQENESNKRKSAALLVEKLRRWVGNWERRDRENGGTHLIHRTDMTPCVNEISSRRWREVDTDAGLGKRVTAHVFRHTCAQWLKIEGVPLWIASDFLAVSPDILVKHYGHWDVHGQVQAVSALSLASKQRESLRRQRK